MDYERKLMADAGVVKREEDLNMCGKIQESRGYYIVIPADGIFYLHHDGTVQNGVAAFSDKPAFWETREAATEFFDEWKRSVIASTKVNGE